MNPVVTTLVILVAAVVLGTGVVLYGTSLYENSTNSTSSGVPLVKPLVTYYKEGVDPTIEIGNSTEKSVILAVDSQSYNFLLTNGETIDPISTHITFYKNHGIDDYGPNTYDGYNINELPNSKVTIYYSILKPTCVYVFNWRHDFHSQYNVDGFNFTQIPNATNYDFAQTQGFANCNDTTKNIEKVEVYVK